MTSLATNHVLQQMHADLHDLAQPLTALQCRLEIGRMHGSQGALQEAVNGSLAETRRIFEVISQMRQRLQHEEETTE